MSTCIGTSEQVAVVRGVIDRAAGLPQRDIANFEQFVEYGEFLVGLEILCDQLYEYSVALSAQDIRALEEIGTSLGMDKEYTDPLWDHVAESDETRPGRRR